MWQQINIRSLLLTYCRNPNDFSLLNLFDLPRGEDNLELRTKFREIGVFYWACLILSPYFILEQYISFHTTRYWWILIPLYILLMLSPFVYRTTQKIGLYAGYIIFIEITIVLVLMGCAGGNFSPGAFWLGGFPMIFGLFYGLRGVKIGSLVMVSAFIGFVALNHFNLLPNLIAETGNYESIKTVNLIGFGVYNIIISFYSIKIETTAKTELLEQRQETENLLRILVHDIATPINAVQLMTHAMKAGGKKPEQMLDLVESALTDMVNIVQQVSKLRALKDGKLALDRAEVAMQDAIEGCLLSINQIAAQKNITIQFNAPEYTIYAIADESLLKSVIICNLLSNAIKFSYPDTQIIIHLTSNDHQVIVQIIDQGIGMSPELLHKVFDPSSPTNRKGTQGERGTGFGLPLVKMLINKLKGDIDIQSKQTPEKSGTTVTITLPKSSL